MTACTRAQTWPGTTALENSLFSWTSLLGVVSNLSAMLFNVSLDSTWTTKEKEITVLLNSSIKAVKKRPKDCDGTEPSVPFSCSVLFLVEKELCHSAKTSRTTSVPI